LLDPMQTSLLLLGKAEIGTGFHVDRTQAENIAFSVATKPQVKHTFATLHAASTQIAALNNLDIVFLMLQIVCVC